MDSLVDVGTSIGVKISPDFSPYSALLGGSLIAAASSFYLLTTGRIAGISGMAGMCVRAFRTKGTGFSLNLPASFLSGMIGSSVALNSFYPQIYGNLAASPYAMGVGTVMLSGFLVGYGTQMGSGCTSGHGVCGLARRSKRSLVAVSAFMGSGMATAITVSQLAPVLSHMPSLGIDLLQHSVPMAAGILGTSAVALALFSNDSVKSRVAAFASGGIFAAGLGVSGMSNFEKVLTFLNPISAAGWDPSLAFVMASAVGVNLLTFNRILARRFPVCETDFSLPTRTEITPELLTGSMLFGAGWALCGVCPGPGIIGLASGSLFYWTWIPSMLGGMFVYQRRLSEII